MEYYNNNDFMAVPSFPSSLPPLLLTDAVAATKSQWPAEIELPEFVIEREERKQERARYLRRQEAQAAANGRTCPRLMPRNAAREQAWYEENANFDSVLDACPGLRRGCHRMLRDDIKDRRTPVSRLPSDDTAANRRLDFSKRPVPPRDPRQQQKKSTLSRLVERYAGQPAWYHPAAAFRRSHCFQQRIAFDELSRYRTNREQQQQQEEVQDGQGAQAEFDRMLDLLVDALNGDGGNGDGASPSTASSATVEAEPEQEPVPEADDDDDDDDDDEDSDDDIGPLYCDDTDSESDDEHEGRRDSGYAAVSSPSSWPRDLNNNKEPPSAAAPATDDEYAAFDAAYPESFISSSSWTRPMATDEEDRAHSASSSPAGAPEDQKEEEEELAPEEQELPAAAAAAAPAPAPVPTNNPHAARFKELFGAGFDVGNLPDAIDDGEDDEDDFI